MKNPSAAFVAAVQSGKFPFIELYLFKLNNGLLVAWTSLDRDVIYTGSNASPLANNQRFYSTVASGGILTRGKITQSRGIESSHTDVTIAYPDLPVQGATYNLGTMIDLGLWRMGVLYLYRAIVPTLNTDGTYSVSEVQPWFLGIVGNAKRDRSKAVIPVDSPVALLRLSVPWRAMLPHCGWQHYDSGCQLIKANYGVNAVVSAGSTAKQVLLAAPNINAAAAVGAGTAAPTGYFDRGVIQFTSGLNNGITDTILNFLGAGAQNSYDALVLADKPLAFYKLDGNANDASGNAYHGTANNMTWGAAPAGPLGDGTSGYGIFNGTNGFIDISAVPHPRNQATYLGGVSFECFYYAAGAPNQVFDSGGNILNAVGFVPIRFQAGVSDAAPGFRWGASHPFAGFTAVSNTWQHVVGVFRGSRYIDVYVNGLFVITIISTGADNYSWVSPTLGKVAGTGGGFYNGRLSRVALYPYAMDSGQVAAHYNASQQAANAQTLAVVNLTRGFPKAIATGDTFTIYPGCDWSMRKCKNWYNNLGNFGGFPGVPPLEAGM